jgi:hypothetical protein
MLDAHTLRQISRVFDRASCSALDGLKNVATVTNAHMLACLRDAFLDAAHEAEELKAYQDQKPSI